MRRLMLALGLLALASSTGCADGDDPVNDTDTDTDTDPDTDTDTDCGRQFFRDADDDGWGDPDLVQAGCEPPEGYLEAAGDCDDEDPDVNPDATEVCGDGVDNDCSGGAPECRVEGTLEVADVSSVLVDDQTGESFGAALAVVPDVDGDGRSDLLVGRPGDDTYRPGNGWVGLFSGLGRDLSEQRPIARFVLRKDYEGLGSAVLGGDYGGGEGTDLILAAPRAVVGESNDVGAVHVILDAEAAGPTRDLVVDPGLVFRGGDRKDQAGRAVALPGDVDGDGAADLAIGAPQPTETKPGRVWIVSGTEGGSLPDVAHTEIIGGPSDQRTGEIVAGVGDHDGDGNADLVVGAGSRSDASGRLYLYTDIAPGTWRAEDATASFDGGTRLTVEQGVVSSAGDVDDDGYDDLWVGLPAVVDAGDQEGAVLLFRGDPERSEWTREGADASLTGDVALQHLGIEVSGGKDLDGDGLPDLAASTRPTSGSAEVWLVYGFVEGTLDAPHARLGAGEDFSRLGTALSSGGDLDGDGFTDLVLGAPGFSLDDGKAVIVWGQAGL